MDTGKVMSIIVENHIITSEHLLREVNVDLYLPRNVQFPGDLSLLLINDGQDLVTMGFDCILDDLIESKAILPILCVGIHCGEDRKNEYGTAVMPDYKGRGAKAGAYTKFIFEELLPFIRSTCNVPSFRDKSICGFSLGGLSAIDIAWNHPSEFINVGVFSGSLWWRMMSQDDPDFDENEHRIMHNEIRNGGYYPWMKFFFATGTQDETADRNNNGVIDAIDDTLNLIDELEDKGYKPNTDICYFEMADGKHDVPTWARAFPIFLRWAWGEEIRNKK